MEKDSIPKLKWDDPKILSDSMISLPPLNLHSGDLLLVMDKVCNSNSYQLCHTIERYTYVCSLYSFSLAVV